MITYVINWSTRLVIGETSEKGSQAEAKVIDAIMHGKIDPAHIDDIVSYDPDEGWSRYVTEDIARACAKCINAMFDHDHTRPHPALYDWVTAQCDAAIPRAYDPTFAAA
jgi:hypothetical protein